MYKVVLSQALCEEGMELLRKQPDVETVVVNASTAEALLPELRDADAFLIRVASMNAETMAQCPKLKVIARPGVGVDTIDVPCATAKGIPVVVTPGANSRSVAEHTLMLMLALAKNLTESLAECKKGNYAVRNRYAAFELEGKTLGVMGFGHIGRTVAQLASALGVNIAVCDPFVPKLRVEEAGYRYCASMEELFPLCDLITLHMLSNDQTRGLLGKEQFAMMRPGALLINCARGDLVQESALYDALVSGHLGGAAEDMMAKEPFDISSPLLALPNFMATPHMAALTRESAARCAVMAVEGILAVLHGEPWPHVFDKAVYAHERWEKKA